MYISTMPEPAFDVDVADQLIARAEAVLETALHQLRDRGGIDANETLAYDLAHSASALAAARSSLAYARQGNDESRLVAVFLAMTLSDLAGRTVGRESLWGVEPGWFGPFQSFVATYRDPAFLAALAETPGRRHLLRRRGGASPRRARAPRERRHSRVHHRGSE